MSEELAKELADAVEERLQSAKIIGNYENRFVGESISKEDSEILKVITDDDLAKRTEEVEKVINEELSRIR